VPVSDFRRFTRCGILAKALTQRPVNQIVGYNYVAEPSVDPNESDYSTRAKDVIHEGARSRLRRTVVAPRIEDIAVGVPWITGEADSPVVTGRIDHQLHELVR